MIIAKDRKTEKDCTNWGLLILRVVVGATFIYHGLPKLLNLAGTEKFFSSLSFFGIFQIPGWFALIFGIVETLGGLWLISGYRIRWPAYALAVDIFFAIVVPLFNGLLSGHVRVPDLELLLLASALLLAWSGPGRWGLSKTAEA